jgi:serine/threonine-protein kinase
MDVDVGKIIAGKYQLEKLIGQGGMGEVWSARHTKLGERVAVKVLRAEPGEDEATTRSRFDLEAKVSARLSRKSRHVVSVIDQGEEDGSPFLVMELLEGESLEDLLERAGVVPLPMVATIVAHVARALLAAHTDGVVHRDLKPANIFLTKDEEGRLLAKVLDFGIARVIESRVENIEIRSVRHTRRGMVIGTPAYMSPEQAKGVRDVGPECDVWALAAMAYEAISGQPPFIGEMREALERLIRGEHTPVTTLRPDAPAALDAVFMRAFQPDKGDRFPNAPALADALARSLGNTASIPDLVLPRSTPGAATMAAPRKRRPWVLAIVLALFLVGAIALVASLKLGTPTVSTGPVPTVTVTVTNTILTPVVPTEVAIPVSALPHTAKPIVPTTKATIAPLASTSPSPRPSSSVDRGEIF